MIFLKYLIKMSSKLFSGNLFFTFVFIVNIQFIFISSLETKKSMFDQTTIKNLKIKNRIFRGAIGDTYFKNGKITEEGFKLYDQLSKNEIGTIITGFNLVSDYGQLDNMHQFCLDKDEYIPEYKKLVDMVHKNGANIITQLAHIGIKTLTKTKRVVYAPSSLPLLNQKGNSKEMTKEDILRIENDFAKAALRAKKAGFDGEEIHAAHHYLISQFLSPLFNKRTDEYGGNDVKRAKFLLEIIEKVRTKVGNDYIIGLKINSEDSDKDGITEEGFIQICQLAEKEGVDYIQVSGMKWITEKIKRPLYEEIGTKLSKILKIPVMII